MELKPKQVNQLLKLIKHPSDRKAVKKFLQEFIKNGSNPTKSIRSDNFKGNAAKKALDIILKSGFEIGKHKVIESLFHIFD